MVYHNVKKMDNMMCENITCRQFPESMAACWKYSSLVPDRGMNGYKNGIRQTDLQPGVI
jgi:hypothetical protein